LQFRGSRKHITNETNGSKHIHRNATEHNTISITNNPVITPYLSINKMSCIKTAILKKSLHIKSQGLDHVTNYQSEYSTSTTKKQWTKSKRRNSTNSIKHDLVTLQRLLYILKLFLVYALNFV